MRIYKITKLITYRICRWRQFMIIIKQNGLNYYIFYSLPCMHVCDIFHLKWNISHSHACRTISIELFPQNRFLLVASLYGVANCTDRSIISPMFLQYSCKQSIITFPLQTSLTGNEDGGKNFNKLEKADILELAVEQLQMLQKHSNTIGMSVF